MKYSINSITIYLGNICNLNCYYCRDKLSVSISDSTDINNLISLIEDNLIFDDIESVTYVGGEPTMYLNDIKVLDNYFYGKQKFIITNGKILPYDYYLSNNYKIILSHNGVNTKTSRGYDPFEDHLNIVRYLNDEDKLLINTVLFPNTDVISEYCYFYDKLGAKFNWGLFGVIGEKYTDPSILINSYTEYLSSYKFINQSAKLLLSRITSRTKSESILLLDRLGNILNNTNDHSIIGNITSTDLYSVRYLPKYRCTSCRIRNKCHSIGSSSCTDISRLVNEITYDFIDNKIYEYGNATSFKEEVVRCLV